MTHLSIEAISEYLNDRAVPGAEEHLATCGTCREELEALRDLRRRLRALPTLQPPADSWHRIAARLPVGGTRARAARLWAARLWSDRRLRQAVGMAAVFLLGLGLGRVFWPGAPAVDSTLPSPLAGTPDVDSELVVSGETPGSLAEAMAEVRRQGAEYEAALRRLETVAREAGTAIPSVAEERLAALDALVEASRTALSAEPTDPVLNAYLFAALDQRASVVQQVSSTPQPVNRTVLWR